MLKKAAPPTTPSAPFEKTKLGLQIAQTIAAVIGATAILIAFFQWQEGQRRAEQDVYRTISKDWNDHLKFFVENPELRPYFFSGLPLDPNNQQAERIHAVADVRIDLMDAVMTHMQVQGWTGKEGQPWRRTFEDAFRNSPVLCDTIFPTWSNYGLVVDVAIKACPNVPPMLLDRVGYSQPRSPS